jgi:thiol-disulfide isomerase/thioredoxin
MDGKAVTVEVNLQEKKLPRESVAEVIWLHDDELAPAGGVATPAELSADTRVQAVRSDGIRLTFLAERLANGTISGASEVLGACRVNLDDVDQLLIGGTIQEVAARLKYGRWRLHPATEPKFVVAGDGQKESSPGTESALVGTPAPDFELKLLDGSTFRLSEQKGRVVVLDFWASWCIPCIQAMPHVDGVVQEFKEQDVRLIAVNLQEFPEGIKSTLDRLKLKTTVALDIDGAVAEKYSATAIPQTVIVDSVGNIAHLFVGGGPQFADQLRGALSTLVKSGDGAASAKAAVRPSPLP